MIPKRGPGRERKYIDGTSPSAPRPAPRDTRPEVAKRLAEIENAPRFVSDLEAAMIARHGFNDGNVERLLATRAALLEAIEAAHKRAAAQSKRNAHNVNKEQCVASPLCALAAQIREGK